MDVIKRKWFADYLQPRARIANKSDFGHVLLVGGDVGYSGAIRLAAEGALRVGAGLVSVVTHPAHAALLNLTRPEIMCHTELQPLLEKVNVIVIGPGLGHSSWAQALLDEVLQSGKNLVVDADALNLLALNPVHKTNWILTPHLGEAARLLKKPVTDIQHDRVTAVKLLQQEFNGVCILKGAGTVVADENSVVQCVAGNPGMATGGTGDVLSGVIGGLLAQGMSLCVAAQLGVFVHATAGDIAAKAGERGMIASDVVACLRGVMNS